MARKIALLIIISVMIIGPIGLMIIPYDYFDYGESICPSKLLFDSECPGCGTTRATMRLFHFRFAEAWEFNRLSFITVPLMGFFYVRIIINLSKKLRAA
ncbi:MAG TPA: DUF2752 domain-containing protein [Bacteroidia bacterium]|nr:DUF2752 domain-containing protein [Bacteroidia bacterium]